MPKIAPFLPPYVGVRPQAHGEYLFGVERPTTIWQELTDLAAEEWGDGEAYQGIMEFSPDFRFTSKCETHASIAAVTLRRKKDFKLVGYFVGTVSKSLVEKDAIAFHEVSFYIKRKIKNYSFKKFLKYIEETADCFGCTGVVLSHHPEHTKIGRLYRMHGYAPMSCTYIKRLDYGKH